ncbi:HAD hydrolase-like protein [Solirubrobacter phytolaccae]|uniref:HAD hydrolase-like protein n=1 Tax=Solirubrobacter phytolaccae TaxID=1404360 RepID=A0A9X3N6H0_9ACTN|nr:HAD hydrolase-like protein [Solirubrobacter phytolaccae]MDA0180643.1 HAD hydrolase-like protein [Solirubrobacter phytolaccae]
MPVLFDLDGVLVDSRAPFLTSLNYAFDKLGLPRRDPEALYPYIGPPFKVAFPGLLGVAPDDPQVDALIDGYRERYATASLEETTVAPGIAEALERLDGEPLAVATSKPRAFAEPLLEALGLRHHFAAIAGPELAARDEPKAVTVTRALELLGTTSAVMIGDRRFDVEGAHANGIQCIGVTWGIGTREELETAGADAIIDDPLELDPALRVMSRP